jgi:putative membrane protein
MMGDWDHGRMMGGGYGAIWIVMVVFWILLLGLITFLVVRLLPGGGSRPSPLAGGPGDRAALPPERPETPEQILDRLFALGEIDEQTYRSRRTALAEMRVTETRREP